MRHPQRQPTQDSEPPVNPSGESGLVAHTSDPYNVAPPAERPACANCTAAAEFHVRGHRNIARAQLTDLRLRIKGLVHRPLVLDLAQIKTRFAHRVVEATLEWPRGWTPRHAEVQRGVWRSLGTGRATGKACWGGAPLIEVLQAACADLHPENLVVFDECDTQGQRFRYGVSIPMSKALSSDVLLAYEMNGEALTPEHGAPLLVVVPGFAGLRRATCLAAITVQEMPADDVIQTHD